MTTANVELTRDQLLLLIGKLPRGYARIAELEVRVSLEQALQEMAPELTDFTGRKVTVTLDGESIPYPKVGDVLVIGPSDDHTGGAVTVSQVLDRLDENPDHPIPGNMLAVKLKELPGVEATWLYLYRNRERLARDYGGHWAISD